MVTGISDFALLRNLAEDVPDMAPIVRAHLMELANRLEFGEKIGSTRCRKCGEAEDVVIRAAAGTATRCVVCGGTQPRTGMFTRTGECVCAVTPNAPDQARREASPGAPGSAPTEG